MPLSPHGSGRALILRQRHRLRHLRSQKTPRRSLPLGRQESQRVRLRRIHTLRLRQIWRKSRRFGRSAIQSGHQGQTQRTLSGRPRLLRRTPRRQEIHRPCRHRHLRRQQQCLPFHPRLHQTRHHRYLLQRRLLPQPLHRRLPHLPLFPLQPSLLFVDTRCRPR